MIRAMYLLLVGAFIAETIYSAVVGKWWQAGMLTFTTIVLVALRGELDTERGI